MRIKHAYNTLLTSKSRGKYDAGKQGSDYSYSTGGFQTRTREAEEEFYGLGINLLQKPNLCICLSVFHKSNCCNKGNYF